MVVTGDTVAPLPTKLDSRHTLGMTANEPQRGRIPADTFSNRLYLARKLAGMTIEQAAEAADVTKSSWANWENGRRPQGMQDICQAIAVALDVDLIWLTYGGPLSPSARPRRVTRRSGEATARYTPVPVRPRVRRPASRPGPSGPAGRSGPIDHAPPNRRRTARISGPIAE
jgi:transcriptional regulator with XRE-family HTH domain